jgi:hypothetical protein
MQPLVKKVAAIGFLVLLVLWVVGLFRAPAPAAATPAQGSFVFNREVSRQQAANNLRALNMEKVPAPLLLDRQEVEGIRIHERSAQMTAVTARFADDEKQVRLAVADHGALVLNERSSGTDGQRRLALEISVRPERFDELTSRLRKVGHLETVSVHQRDRTDEFHHLREQAQRLKKQREEVSKVSDGRIASVEDRLRILQKLQEIDKEQQGVARQAGDLLGKESYYQVYFNLSEDQLGASPYGIESVPRRAWNALLWALPWWCVAMALLSVLPAVYVSLKALLPRRAEAAPETPASAEVPAPPAPDGTPTP